MEVPNINKLKGPQFTEKYFLFHYPEFRNYINTNYPSDLTFQEKLYWYYNDVKDYPVCPVCGKRLKLENTVSGYWKTCSKKCSNRSIEKKEKIKNIIEEKYGGFGFGSPIISKKIDNTNIEKYGTKFVSQNPEVYERQKNTNIKLYGGQGNASQLLKEKYKQTNIEKYNVDNYGKTDECREKMQATCLDRYGVSSFSKTNEFQEKTYITKKKHNSFHTSKIEQDLKKWLDENGIEYRYQYMSDAYPFACDFYFPITDSYLEIDASWTHGFHAFDPNDPKDIEKLNSWESKKVDHPFYVNAIETWTVRDPNKKEVAKQNGVKLYNIYSHDLSATIRACRENGLF